MTKCLRFITFLVLSLCMQQSLFAQFARSVGGTDADNGQALAYDAAGNTYIIGDFRGKADFDPGPGTLYLKSSCPCDESNPLLPDIFFAKYSRNGALIWARQVGGSGYDYGRGIGVDDAGNVYITGSFESTADFDPGTGISNLVAAGGKNIFLAKYTASGNYLWASNIGSGAWGEGNSLSVSNAGILTVAGYFNGTADFDPSAGIAAFNAGGFSDPFFARYTADGTYMWAKTITGSGESSGQHLYVDSAGAIYFTGNFYGTADFNTGAGVFELTGTNAKDAFYAKYTASGEFVWATRVGGNGDESGTAIIADKAGNVYATGYYINEIDFDPGAGIFNMSSGIGAYNGYLLKLNKDGLFEWANNIYSGQFNVGLSLSLDAQQNVYATGYFSGTTSFSPATSITSAGGTDIFIAVYKSTGALLNIFKEGGITNDWASAIAVDAKGFIYVTGYYTGAAQFTINGAITTLTSAGNGDVYFLKAKRKSLQTAAVAAATATDLMAGNSSNAGQTMLHQNIPNPAQSYTTVAYNLGTAAQVRLSLVDMNGKEVMVLKNAMQQKGLYTLQVNVGRLKSGIYIWRLAAGNEYFTKKLVVQ
ncbi:SBBP repeat-containing protein [Panacibacter sp. DH6]|uniref:SBBP repeat-containing protein n=1 Tax=Panacibacter microcysteis TaxID=2793269 RepID=A0A931GXL3_9BACT|nr:SBBP repeat-containing protein [Panacibacter microcysteis]MBG9376019.1 SBBP repeat-containing protein [Panacibacter microcysteis]